MSHTTDFVINNPGKNFDGSPLEETPSITWQPLPMSKSQVNKLATVAVDNVLEKGNVFEVAEAIAAMEEFTKQVRKDERFVDYCREELRKNNGNYTTLSGAKIEASEAGVTYDYSADTAWEALENQIQDLIAQRKALEVRLRTIPAGKQIVDAETGEVFTGPFRSSKSTYKLTLKR